MQLTKKHLGLIEWQLSTLNKVPPRFHDDLRSAGHIGLLNAVRTYDESKGAQFETYATACIRNAMLNELRSTQTEKVSRFLPTDPKTLEETVVDDSLGSEEAILLEEKWREGWNRLMDILPELSYRQEFILMHRIYCADEDELTQAEIASRFKCNQSTIQREEKRLYDYLKDAGKDYIRNDR